MAYDQGITQFWDYEVLIQSDNTNMFILPKFDPIYISSLHVQINGIGQPRSTYDVQGDVLAFKPGIVLKAGDLFTASYAL